MGESRDILCDYLGGNLLLYNVTALHIAYPAHKIFVSFFAYKPKRRRHYVSSYRALNKNDHIFASDTLKFSFSWLNIYRFGFAKSVLSLSL